MNSLLTIAQMYRADSLAIASGISGETLMEAAGAALADEIAARWDSKVRILILCGPGNNGGDGYVVARLLDAKGYQVRVASLVKTDQLTGDAATMAARWQGDVLDVSSGLPKNLISEIDLIVDCLFGAGLTRALEGVAAEIVAQVGQSGLPIVAVDLPSGVNGDTGAIVGIAFKASLTVTFFRKKPGHLLLPGRGHCGEVVVADIGIPSSVLDEIQPNIVENTLSTWCPHLNHPNADDHKYTRGHAIVVSGGMTSTGAARLAARAALRIGAGAVTVASPPSALAVNAANLTAIMLRRLDDETTLTDMLADRRIKAVLIGPGNGIGPATRANVLQALNSNAAIVLDADALTVFENDPDILFKAIAAHKFGPVIMTPHEGEFQRLFNDIGRNIESSTEDAGGKVGAAQAAARASGATIIYKGADSVIATPDGQVAINANAPPWLATAGSGDVLSGFVAGLLAQGMSAFGAACGACWMHGEAGARIGRGLIAEDLSEIVPDIFRDIDPD
ncbi:MAG: NAD(P)H-hydrate dehydratase [Rhizobiales bacterium]|nr:NAD(P)H-hydrate dehydratase [Hyphomicrobiales bacterium]